MNIKYLKLVTGEELVTEYIDEGWRTSGKHEAWLICKKLPE